MIMWASCGWVRGIVVVTIKADMIIFWELQGEVQGNQNHGTMVGL